MYVCVVVNTITSSFWREKRKAFLIKARLFNTTLEIQIGMALQLTESIIRGLEEAQNSANNHPKLIATFLTLYEKTEADVFFRAFFPAFSNILLVYKREPAVERVVTFVTSFAVQTAPREKNGKASAYEYAHSSGHRIDVFLFSLLVESNDEEEDSDTDEEVEISFFSLLIDRLLTLHQAKDKAVRYTKLVPACIFENLSSF